MAADLGVHLSEHGGTGIGVIGALAGAGLRLSGNDGRFKGKFAIPNPGWGRFASEQIKQYGVDSVQTFEGDVLGGEELVVVGEQCKLVLLGGEAVLLVAPTTVAGPARMGARRPQIAEVVLALAFLERTALGVIFRGTVGADEDLAEAARIAAACDEYRRDDEDEDLLEGALSCFGCRYRRWVPGGFTCVKDLLAA